MASSADLTYSLEVAKYSARQVLGVLKTQPKSDELLYLLNKQMLFQILSDPSCLEELSLEEQAELEGLLKLKS